MPTPPASQGAPTWSSSSGGATYSSASASPSCSSAPSSSPPAVPVPTSSRAPSSSSPHAAPSSSGCRATSAAASPPPPSCAACRHQRRRCPPHCLLRPYFVADEPDKFRNALRMFGAKNLQRMLREVPPPRREVCVQTIVYESNVRAADPVRGCCGVIQDLENQLMGTAVELEVLRRRLESYRQMTTRDSGSHSQSQPPDPLAIQQQQQQLMARTSGDDVQTQAHTAWHRRERAHHDTATVIRDAATALHDGHDLGRCSHARDSPRRSRSCSRWYSDNRQT